MCLGDDARFEAAEAAMTSKKSVAKPLTGLSPNVRPFRRTTSLNGMLPRVEDMDAIWPFGGQRPASFRINQLL